ncbi:MAG: hypothetical protein IID37_05000 [Planctomycetes bacterium]|nr:hypothetical protein [Planctomycetota bacterium]
MHHEQYPTITRMTQQTSINNHAAFIWSVAILQESSLRIGPLGPDARLATLLFPLALILLTTVIAFGVLRNAASRPSWRLLMTLSVIGALAVSPVAAYVVYLYYLAPAYIVASSLRPAVWILSCPYAFVLILYCIGHVVRSARHAEHIDLDLHPICEGCGYDLTYQPGDQRCPECGRAVRESLEPDVCRSDSTWERAGGMHAWVRAFMAVLFEPKRFYGAMRVRTGDETAVTFGRWNHVLLGVGGGCWVLFTFLTLLPKQLGPTLDELLVMAPAAGLATVLACWLGHRLGAALVVSLWMVRRCLPDYRWACKVIEYESAFLWVFCVFWGVLAAAGALDARLQTNLLGSFVMVGPMPLPLGLVVFLGGTVTLSVGWYWRYQIALRAIRWNNF